MDLREFFTPEAIAAQWNETASNRIPYMGAGLFPARKKSGLDLSWLKGSKGLPVSLMPSAFDAKATFRDRIGFEKLETQMPFFREGFKIKERDRHGADHRRHEHGHLQSAVRHGGGEEAVSDHQRPDPGLSHRR